MKLHLTRGLRTALAARLAVIPAFATITTGVLTIGTFACSIGQQAVAADAMYTIPDYGGTEYTWTSGTNWNDGTDDPVRSNNKGPVLIFDDAGTINVSRNEAIDTSDSGGIKVTGDSDVTVSAGRWGGSLYVGVGAVLNTKATIAWKNTEATGVANFYVEGTLNLTNNHYTYDGNNAHNWHIGPEGVINMTGISTIDKNSSGTLNVELVAAHNAVRSELVGRTYGLSLQEHTYINAGGEGVINAIDTKTVWLQNADGTGATELTLNTEGDLTEGQYKIVTTDPTKLTIQYLAQGYAAMNLTWSGTQTQWAETGTGWHADGSSDDVSFIAGDSVSFSNDGTSQKTVTISGTVAPKNIDVDGKFIFSGNGSIAATGTLNLTADSSLEVNNKGGDTAFGGISIGDNASLSLHTHTAKTTVHYGSLTLGNNAAYTSVDGSYEYSSLALTESASSATLNLNWDKTTKFGAINAEGKTLNINTDHSNAGDDAHKLQVTGELNAQTINFTGTLQLASTQAVNADINVVNSTRTDILQASGLLKLAEGKTLTVNDGTSFRLHYGTGFEGDIVLNGGGKIEMNNGAGTYNHLGTSNNTITINSTSDNTAVITSAVFGANSRINSNITGNGTLELTRGTNGNLVTINGEISDGENTGDQLALHVSGSTDTLFAFTHANTYTGDTTIAGSTLTLKANGALGTVGEVTITGNKGKLVVDAGKEQSNTVNFTSADDASTPLATLSDATWAGNTLTSAGISGGSITGGLLSVAGTHSLSNVTLNNMGVLVNGGTLTLTGAIEGSGSTIMVGSGATPLAEGDAATTPAGGTLDLSNVTTLSANINLMSGSTLILGDYLTNGALTYTGSLNIEDGVIIDLSAWCKNTAEEPGVNLTVFQAWQPIFTYSGSDAEALNLLAGMDGRHVTIKLANGYETQYGTLRYDAANQSLLLVPEPTTATLSLLALAGLAARRRRK